MLTHLIGTGRECWRLEPDFKTIYLGHILGCEFRGGGGGVSDMEKCYIVLLMENGRLKHQNSTDAIAILRF